jgi:hypothetical protein
MPPTEIVSRSLDDIMVGWGEMTMYVTVLICELIVTVVIALVIGFAICFTIIMLDLAFCRCVVYSAHAICFVCQRSLEWWQIPVDTTDDTVADYQRSSNYGTIVSTPVQPSHQEHDGILVDEQPKTSFRVEITDENPDETDTLSLYTSDGW